MRLLVVLLLAAGVALGGFVLLMEGSSAKPEQTSEVYNVPLAQARAILLQMGLPKQIYAWEQDVRVDGSSDPNRIAWILQANQVEVYRFVAAIAAEGPQKTRIWVDVQAPKSASDGDNDAARMFSNAGYKNFYIVTMREQIAATLEKHAYNLAKVNAAWAPAIPAAAAEIAKTANRLVAADRQQTSDAIARAYANEGSYSRTDR